MNKKISFPIAIIIILACAILVASLTIWWYLTIPKGEISKVALSKIISEDKEETKEDNLNTDLVCGKVDQGIGWGVCKNEKYGFEIKYPNDWYNPEKGPEEIIPVASGGMLFNCVSNAPCISCINLWLEFRKVKDLECETSVTHLPTSYEVRKKFSEELTEEGWPEKKEVGNLVFCRDYSEDHAAGGKEWRVYTYKTLHNDVCYKIILNLMLGYYYGYVDECMGGPYLEFDTGIIRNEIFFPMLSTFRFLE